MKVNVSWKKKLRENILWSVIGKQTNQAVKGLLEDRLGIDDGNKIIFFLYYWYIKVDSILLCVCSVIDDGKCQIVVRTSVALLCSYHILTNLRIIAHGNVDSVS